MNQSRNGKGKIPQSSRKQRPTKQSSTKAPRNNNIARRAPARIQRAPRFNNTPGGIITQQYIKSQADPFEYGPVQLGFGALIPTRTTTIYFRGSTTSNADGSLAVMLYPQAGGFINYANGGAAVSFATSASNANATDFTTISANAGSARFVSMGLKAYPNLAATTTPGQVVTGSLPGSTFNLSQALTPNDLVSFPTSHVGKGYDGAVACARPQDLNSFDFYPQMVNASGFLTTTPLPCSLPYICFTGIGSGTTVYIEAQLNIEYIEELQHSSAPMGQSSLEAGRTLASEWENLEKMWSRVKVLLPDPGRIGYDSLSGTGSLTGTVMNQGGKLSYGGQLARNGRN